jgi:ketosteroid isomerase-like protein
MSQENINLVRAVLEAFVQGRSNALTALVHTEFEMVQLPLHPEAGTLRGWKAADESMRTWRESFDEFRWEAEEFIDAGDQVVFIVRELGRGRGGGVDLDHRYGAVCTVQDGKIARLEWFNDKQRALEAAATDGA